MIQNRSIRIHGLQRFAITALVLAVFALEGCVKRTEFELQAVSEGGIEIALEWPETATPTPMSFAFYRTGEGTLLYKEFEGTSAGFKGKLPVGDYKVIAYDKNAQRVGYRNMETHAGAEVYAQSVVEGSKTAKGTLITEPGVVYFAGECVDMVTLTVSVDKTLKATAKPLNRTRTVMLKFDIINGPTITSITGALDGVSSSVMLCSGQSSDYSARLPFLVNRTDDDFTTSIALFDFIAAGADDTQVNTMDVTLNEDTGNTYEISLDLTDTIREIIDDNDGVIPVEIPIEVKIDMTDINNITAIVIPWENGTGGGDVIG